MAYASGFVKVQIIGTCFDDQEIWTTQFTIQSNGNVPRESLEAVAPLIAARWETFFTTPLAGFSSRYKTTAIKANWMGMDGKQVTDPTVEYVYPVPVGGGAASTTAPPQCCLVLSLRAAIDRGPATKGRMYLPITAPVISADGRITAASISTILAGARSFIAGVNSDCVPILSGPVSLVSPIGPGHYNTVTRLLMGRVYDTQRRRRGNLEEGYITVLL